MVRSYLRSYLLDYRIVHPAANKRAIRLHDDIVGFTVFDDFLLLTKWVELHSVKMGHSN